MLAGCSSAIAYYHQNQSSSQMSSGTQRFDITCGFTPRREASRINIDERRNTNLGFRENYPTTTAAATALVVKSVAPWEAKVEVEDAKKKSLKRFYYQQFLEDDTDDEDSGGVGKCRRKRSRRSQLADEDVAFEDGGGFLGMPSTAAMVQGSLINPTGNNEDGDCSSDDNENEKEIRNENENENENENAVVEMTTTCGGVSGCGSPRMERQGLELMSLLMACLQSVVSKNIPATNYFISKLGEHASPYQTSIHRLVSYYTEGLVIRISRLWPNFFCVFPPASVLDAGEYDDDGATAVRLLNHVSPIPKFLQFAMNEMILRSFEGKDKLHIIDLDIKEGLQWPSLFQSLAHRKIPPAHLRITGVGHSKQQLQDTATRLAGFADILGLPFEFHPVVEVLEDVRFWMLHVKPGESVAVNCPMQLHTAVSDETLQNILTLIQTTDPGIVVVSEEEADHDDPRWEMRLVSSLPYYAAVFDSIDVCLPPAASPARVKIEEMYGREIRNLVSCDVGSRYKSFAKWEIILKNIGGRGGFRNVGVSLTEVDQSTILLKMFSSSGKNFKVGVQGDANATGITLYWLDQPLYTVSGWVPANTGARSSGDGN